MGSDGGMGGSDGDNEESGSGWREGSGYQSVSLQQPPHSLSERERERQRERERERGRERKCWSKTRWSREGEGWEVMEGGGGEVMEIMREVAMGGERVQATRVSPCSCHRLSSDSVCIHLELASSYCSLLLTANTQAEIIKTEAID